jgi:2-keto-4-pentenoate hydratase/2-oxohepta-3-ene-1,7-dioic acid hydratase in catechol pathway
MGNGYFKAGYQDRITHFDLFFRNVPDQGGYAIAAGLEQVIEYIQDLHFEMQLNGETRQVGWTGDMLHTVDQIIAYASRFYLLKMGDLIFTGTPKGVGKVHEGDLITAQLEGKPVLECRIR